MRLLLLALLLAILCVQAAFAQDNSSDSNAGAATATAGYSFYFADDFGFALKLPDSGTIRDSAAADWSESPEVAFQWIGSGTPVKLIQVRVDSFDTALDEDIFNAYCSALIEKLNPDESKYSIPISGGTDPADPDQERLRMLAIPDEENMLWKMAEVKDESNPDKTVFYSVFTRFHGNSIYTLSAYYDVSSGEDETIKDYMAPVLSSFQFGSAPGA